MRAPGVQEQLSRLGVEAAPTTPQQATGYIDREIRRWDKLLCAACINAE